MRVIAVATFLCVSIILRAQSTYIPLGSYSMHQLERLEIKSGMLAEPHQFNTTSKSYQRHRIANYVDSFNVVGCKLSAVDYFNLSYLQADNFEFSNSQSPRSKRSYSGFFKTKAACLHHQEKDFTFVINPITLLQNGYDTRLKKTTSINSRGIELRGTIGHKVGFYTTFNDEILVPTSWVYEFYRDHRAVPGQGFTKVPSTDSVPTYINYSNASGYITIQPNRYIDLQFGHGSNFIGNGYRTFYLSNFSRNHLFLRANTRIWKINYTNIWGQMYDWVNPSQRQLPKRHYYATTHANINLTKKLNVGLFQTVSFQRDSGYANGGYDLEYLNPIIFFKPIENGLNSPDKTILGADFKYLFGHRFQLYGQAVISEFKLQELLSNSGWFGNKWATQLGLKYVDALGIKNLDVQLERNVARPYMYTSFNALNAYVNYNQNMAHPLGANFYEYIGILRYQPTNRISFKGTLIYAIYGNDTNNSNWGKNISIAYGTSTLPQLYGNTIAQGVKTTLLMADLLTSYMIKHNLFIDVQVVYRKTDSEISNFNTRTIFVNGTLRWNFAERRWDF
jgi:hypothetical protein